MSQGKKTVEESAEIKSLISALLIELEIIKKSKIPVESVGKEKQISYEFSEPFSNSLAQDLKSFDDGDNKIIDIFFNTYIYLVSNNIMEQFSFETQMKFRRIEHKIFSSPQYQQAMFFLTTLSFQKFQSYWEAFSALQTRGDRKDIDIIRKGFFVLAVSLCLSILVAVTPGLSH